ncbi:MAG: AAA family ATPase [Acutalibacter sp.]|nr:AAA family ATPase [Acutalibacter sp.]
MRLPGTEGLGVQQAALEQVKKELEEIVGLGPVKDYILSLEDNFKIQQMRKARGLKADSPSMHMIFTGNPGTGKTTMARIVARYLKAIGLLSGGQLVEVARADLVGQYVGHTAPLTQKAIQAALGGVLFIDEAYALYRGKDDSFGLEAIDALVKGMEDNRESLVVILAGYSREMEEFLTANSGLRSRFPHIIEFPDYSPEELWEITQGIVNGKGYRMDEACRMPLLQYFERMGQNGERDKGNGRMARNKVEQAVIACSRRNMKEPEEKRDLELLLPEDFDLE